MKIHQNALESNSSFAIAQNLYKIPNNKSNNRVFLLPLVGKDRSLHSVMLDDTSIIILGEDPDQILDLSIYIQKHCARNEERIAKIVSLREFIGLSLGEQNTSNFIYIVGGSAEDLSDTLLIALLKNFTNIFIFQPPIIKSVCGYSGHIKAAFDVNDVLSALRDDDKLLRKYHIYNLNKYKFLSINQKVEQKVISIQKGVTANE